MSQETEQGLPPQNARGFTVMGYLLFAIVFIGFGGWSYLAPLGSAAPAPGSLVVKSERQVVQHLEGGILKELFVRQGDRVSAGQILAKLDVTQVQANLDVAWAQLNLANAKITRLRAELAGAEEIIWPLSLTESNNLRVSELIEEQLTLFDKRRASLRGELSILERRVAQLKSRISGLNDTRITRLELLRSYEKEFESLSQLLAEGFVDDTRVRSLERKIVELRGGIQTIGSDIKSAEIQIGETELQVIQRTSVYDAEVQTQLAELQSIRIELQEKMRVTTDRLDRSEIKAPVPGVILTIEVTTTGGVVPSGRPFITLVPNEDELLIEARLNPIDVDRVSKGQDAEVQFSSFDQNAIPKTYGVVESISADAFVDRNTGGTYYTAKLSIPDDELSKLAGFDLVPGMPVNVLIQTGERTLWQYLTKPLAQGMSKAMIED